jgi:2-polyprenyl-3-methyl-5-hydroxy-6-metoxy-1,4-benzoquinol methylase
MLIAEIIWGLLALNQLADAVRNRRRFSALPRLGDGEGEQAAGFRVVTAPGVHVDEQTRRAALVHIRASGLAALDLVPGQARMDTAWSLGCHVDPEASRAEGWHAGATACHAFLAPEELLEAMGVEEGPALGTFVALAGEVKRRVKGRHDLAIAPGLVAMRPNPFFRAELLGVRLGGGIGPVAIGMPLMWAIVGLGLVLAPWAGLVVAALLLLQGPLSVLGTDIKVRGWWWQAPLRVPVDFINWLRLLASSEVSAEQDAADRAVYTELLAEGTAAFFEPEATHCPMCGSDALRTRLTMPDVFQGKPGKFRLRRCRGCRHTFQDPRLNARGLAFYYRDAYDGRNASGMDTLFGSYVQPYEDRIDMVAAHHTARRWLDVGCGHGHLCAKGQRMLPGVRFDGLDMGAGVETARARGWLDTAHLGLFPDRAESLAGAYDVVSMSHYLEHTVDPRAEISAAHTVLEPGGVLLIEVPDPDSRWIALLGRFWMPWFQPQHLHFVSSIQLAALLREAGFQPIAWATGSAHQGSDLVLAAYTWLRWLARPLDVPWRRPPSLLARLWSVAVWVPGSGLLVLALMLDLLLRPVGRRLHHASAYRVVARRMSGPVR